MVQALLALRNTLVHEEQNTEELLKCITTLRSFRETFAVLISKVLGTRYSKEIQRVTSKEFFDLFEQKMKNRQVAVRNTASDSLDEIEKQLIEETVIL